MALKLSLKANEKLIVAGAVIRNGSRNCEIYIENNAPILRQKDILSEADANTPARRIYFVVQLMYIDSDNVERYLELYRQFAQDIAAAAPSCQKYLAEISDHIAAGRYYRALKSARHLIDHETELVDHAQAEAFPDP